MQPFLGRFALPRLERVIAGPGTHASLAAEVERYGCSRVVVVTGTTVGASPVLARTVEQLGSRCSAVFTGARQHVPSGSVTALLQVMRESDADCLVSLGGGSPIDTAKAAVQATLPPRSPGDRTAGGLVHIAIPTTLSAGEFTDVAGITDETTRIKHALFDTRLAPRTVIADPLVTLDTPAWLWAASGIRALDHAIETLYADVRHPISEPLAERGLERLIEHLPRSIEGPADELVARRGECQLAAWQAVFGVTNAGFGLSHVLGHQIGPRWNVAHGVTSAIVLPHVMRFMAEAAPDRFAAIARVLAVTGEGSEPRRIALACADRIAAFIAQFGLALRLRDVAVPRDELGAIAALVADLMSRAHAVPRPVTRDDVAAVLTAAY
jgi:alcohol dehydrogenase